jgi:hypothetical protein
MTQTQDNLHLEVLNFALVIEDSVNNLLLYKLGIEDKKSTKNFGNKAGITFQSKIDLLYDIGIFEKNEHQNFELQMMFRNKFLHDISFTSFLMAIEKFDNSIVNRLKRFGNEKLDSNTEFYYRNAYNNLFLSNLKSCLDAYKKLQIGLAVKKDYIVKAHEDSMVWIDQFFDLSRAISIMCEESNLENPAVMNFANSISKLCKDKISRLENNENINAYTKYLEDEGDKAIKDIIKF